MNAFVIIFLLLIISLTGNSQSINRELSSVSFEISNLGVNTVNGTIHGMSGDISFNTENLSDSYFNVCVDPLTLNTGIEKRDIALQNEDYFHMEKYLTICFRSTKINKTSTGYTTFGRLTIRGITKEVELPFTINKNELKGQLEINRQDYDIGPSGGFLVGRTVNIEIICVLD
jgi:polyisoprenoid-binding protein YceI